MPMESGNTGNGRNLIDFKESIISSALFGCTSPRNFSVRWNDLTMLSLAFFGNCPCSPIKYSFNSLKSIAMNSLMHCDWGNQHKNIALLEAFSWYPRNNPLLAVSH